MAIFQGILFLFFGVGLLLINYQSLSRGWLPCGSNGLKGRLEFHRDRQPFLYWLMFSVYGIAGFCLVAFAIALLFDRASPLPLR